MSEKTFNIACIFYQSMIVQIDTQRTKLTVTYELRRLNIISPHKKYIYNNTTAEKIKKKTNISSYNSN